MSGQRFRCSVAAAEAPMAGSAGDESSFLLVEHPGTWGNKALAESRFGEEVRSGLAQAAARAGVRVMLVRRHGRPERPGAESFRVFLCHASVRDPWIETTVVSTPEKLLELDLDGLARGRRPGLGAHDDHLFLVCTNGRRDACCAELGRPVVSRLSAAHPEQTWEVTHLGGHRFAGAMLTLPHGLSYGRLAPDSALRIAELTLDGRLDAGHMRGRTAYDAPVQAAEIALLQELGETTVDALHLEEAHRDADGRTHVVMRSRAGRHARVVTETASEPVRTSCTAEQAKPTSRFGVEPG